MKLDIMQGLEGHGESLDFILSANGKLLKGF